jgi:hypothetical protein
MDDVLLFRNGSCIDAFRYKEVLDMYMKATSMKVNAPKSSISFNGIPRAQKIAIKEVLPFSKIVFNKGFKYLGFCSNPNNYGHHDWSLCILR